MKKFLTMALVFVMMFSMVGCGISYSDITGDWTAKTINGKSIDEYAASLGCDPSQATVNVNITDNDKLTITSTNGSQKFDYERRSNGIELKEEGKDTVYMSMSYNKDDKTLSYKMDLGNNNIMEVVLEKGKADITSAIQDETAQDGTAQDDAAAADDGTAQDDAAAADDGTAVDDGTAADDETAVDDGTADDGTVDDGSDYVDESAAE